MNSNIPKIAVMLSVYNGEKYLEEQIESIIKQSNVNVSIYIRNDGSTDKTTSILNSIINVYPNIHFYNGNNIGIKDSFLNLVSYVPDDFEYYAFSDADDFWLDRKLISAIDILQRKSNDIPQAYCSQISLVDENLKFIRNGSKLKKPIAFGNAVVECRMSGATSVFNKRLLDIVRSLDHAHAVMHDAWLNLIATAFGEVYFDPDSYILYRQHGQNADGGMRDSTERWKFRSERYKSFIRYARQAESLLEQTRYIIAPDKRVILENIVDFTNKKRAISFLKYRQLYYQRFLSKIITAYSIYKNRNE